MVRAALAPTTTARVLTLSHVSVNLKSIVGIGRLDRRVGSRPFVRLIPPQAAFRRTIPGRLLVKRKIPIPAFGIGDIDVRTRLFRHESRLSVVEIDG